LRFPLIAIVIAACLFGIGYNPSVYYEGYDGPKGLAYGLGLALGLMIPTFYIMAWARTKSQQIFLLAFGAGFLLRLLLVVVLFFVYVKVVETGIGSFTLSFGTGYLALLVWEIYSFLPAFTQKNKPEPPSEEGEEGDLA
jgi:hypothetical protein